MIEANLDAYAKGFDHYKAKVAAAYGVDGLDAIQPGDWDDAEMDGDEAGEDSRLDKP